MNKQLINKLFELVEDKKISKEIASEILESMSDNSMQEYAKEYNRQYLTKIKPEDPWKTPYWLKPIGL